MANSFYLSFQIEGIPELDRILYLTHEKLNDFKKPLQEASDLVLRDVEVNFLTEGSLAKDKWPELKEATVKERIREGFGGEHPILQRTGKLRKSFYSRVTNTKAVVTSRSSYFVYHQSRLPRTKIPRRAMLLLTERTRQNIVQVFRTFVGFNTL